MFLCLVALYLLVFFACAVKPSSREGYWSPVAVFGITAFYYYLSLPLELYLRGEEIFTTYPATFEISSKARNTIGCWAILALIGFVSGHRLSGLGCLLAQGDAPPPRRLPKSFHYLAIVALILFLLLYGSAIFEKLAYRDATARRYSDPIFAYLTRLCLLFGCLGAGMLIQRRGVAKLPALAITALVVGWGLYTSDKNPLLKVALALSTFWLGKRSRSLKHLYFYCGAAVVAIAALPLFSAFRANLPVDVHSAVTDFSVQNTDAKGPMISVVASLEQDRGRLYGRSYLFALVAWIPRSIWPDRPYDLAQELAFDEIPNWQPGMGLGYSPLAEAYLNFGHMGVFLQFFGVAFALGRLWRALYNLLSRYGATAYWRAMLTVTYFEIIILMHRVPSSSIPQSCIFELFIPIAAFYWIDVDSKAAWTRQPRLARRGHPDFSR